MTSIKNIQYKIVSSEDMSMSTYSIGSDGSIKNLSTGNILKPKFIENKTNGRSYSVIDITINGKRTRRYIHKLVADQFLPNPYGFECIKHKTDDRKNNSIYNLKRISKSENSMIGHKERKSVNNNTGERNIHKVLNKKKNIYFYRVRWSVDKKTKSKQFKIDELEKAIEFRDKNVFNY